MTRATDLIDRIEGYRFLQSSVTDPAALEAIASMKQEAEAELAKLLQAEVHSGRRPAASA
jgi:hypothetical protein